MAAEDKPIICEYCKKGCVAKRMKEMAFGAARNVVGIGSARPPAT
jgi:hypothetical protein